MLQGGGGGRGRPEGGGEVAGYVLVRWHGKLTVAALLRPGVELLVILGKREHGGVRCWAR